MSTRRKPTPGCCLAAFVFVLLLYPLSFGPACWITSRRGSGGAIVTTVYRPLTRCFVYAPESSIAGDALWWYAHVGAAPDWRWMPTLPDQPPGWEWMYWPHNPPP